MRPLDAIEARIEALAASPDAAAAAAELLTLGEEVLEHWICAKDEAPTQAKQDGFRLLALHRQGAKDVPSFNACRETCRELVYHHNLIIMQPGHPETAKRLRMAGLVANHLYLFVRGKLEESQLGEFCCSSKPVRSDAAGDNIGEQRGI